MNRKMSDRPSVEERLAALETDVANLKDREKEDRADLYKFKEGTFRPFADKTDKAVHQLFVRVSLGFGIVVALKFAIERFS